jgi:hypothetical protein
VKRGPEDRARRNSLHDIDTPGEQVGDLQRRTLQLAETRLRELRDELCACAPDVVTDLLTTADRPPTLTVTRDDLGPYGLAWDQDTAVYMWVSGPHAGTPAGRRNRMPASVRNIAGAVNAPVRTMR